MLEPYTAVVVGLSAEEYDTRVRSADAASGSYLDFTVTGTVYVRSISRQTTSSSTIPKGVATQHKVHNDA